MDCPQCGARVPAGDAFCGKCGYAMRDQAPDRLDQSRIRVHEEPEPTHESQEHTTSRQRIRKHTVLGMPSAKQSSKPGPEPAALAPTAPKPSGSARGPSRVSQRTMLGIPRSEVFPRPEEPDTPDTAGIEGVQAQLPVEEDVSVGPGASSSHRPRARVRYDSADEPFPVVRRRRRALGALAVFVLLAAAWLGYRFFTVHG